MLQEQARIWTIRELMKFAIDHLRRNGFAEARLNVELLLSHALRFQRIELYTNFEKVLTGEEVEDFRSLYERRLNREPVQYIVGSAGFMGLQFSVDPRVLIPRPETETLVEQAMLVCGKLPPREAIAVLDVGTGCGNIAVSLAKYVPTVFATGIDVSSDALDVARQNAAMHGVESRTRFIHLDVLRPLDEQAPHGFDVLAANPPYIPRGEWEFLQEEVRRFEPRAALTDERDGTTFHRRIIELAPLLVREEGYVVLEVGSGQADGVSELMRRAGFSGISVTCDLQGVPRVVLGSCARKTGT